MKVSKAVVGGAALRVSALWIARQWSGGDERVTEGAESLLIRQHTVDGTWNAGRQAPLGPLSSPPFRPQRAQTSNDCTTITNN